MSWLTMFKERQQEAAKHGRRTKMEAELNELGLSLLAPPFVAGERPISAEAFREILERLERLEKLIKDQQFWYQQSLACLDAGRSFDHALKASQMNTGINALLEELKNG